MSKFKMVCLDIDGTLLNSEHKISKRTKEVIGVVSNEKQIPVILVSARMPKGIIPLQKELNLIEPLICYSGSLVIHKDSSILLNKQISLSKVQAIYDFIKNTDVHMSLYKDNEWYIEELDEWAKQESEITSITPNIIDFNKLFKEWAEKGVGANKILCMAKPSEIQHLNEKLKEIEIRGLNMYPSKPTYLEIMSKEASKTSAIEFLCKKLNIKSSEVIAIGDNYNDIDMIEYAGLGIAMGNAPSKVKESADEITFTNDEDGVAKALEKYAL